MATPRSGTCCNRQRRTGLERSRGRLRRPRAMGRRRARGERAGSRAQREIRRGAPRRLRRTGVEGLESFLEAHALYDVIWQAFQGRRALTIAHPDEVMRVTRRATTIRTPPDERSRPEPTSADREVLPIPDRRLRRPRLRGREGSGGEVPADRAAASAGGRAERPDRPDRRRRLRLLERVRRPVPDADGGAPGRRRAEVHPLPHDGAVLADARGAALGPQPPHGRHGRDHRDRDLGARVQLDPPEHLRAAGGDAEAERLRDGAVRQVPRGAGVGDEPARAVRLVADAAAAASSTSTASSAARRTSTTRRSTRGRRRSSPTRRRRRATTSPRT